MSNSYRKGKFGKNKSVKPEKNELLFKIDGSIYGQVTKILGDCNFMVFCFDGMERLCHIRKSIRRQTVCMGSIVLVGLRDYQDNKGDIILVYSREHVAELKRLKEIPDMSTIGPDVDYNEENEENEFDFDGI